MKLRKFEEMASDSLESIAQSLGLWTNRSGNGIIEFGDDNESGLLVKFERY
jgi:hypothetical protein